MIKLCGILEQLNQGYNSAERVTDSVENCIFDSEEQELSTQFLQKEKKQLRDLQKHFEHYCIVLLIFAFNSENMI